jgi:hypothetical protein
MIKLLILTTLLLSACAKVAYKYPAIPAEASPTIVPPTNTIVSPNETPTEEEQFETIYITKKISKAGIYKLILVSNGIKDINLQGTQPIKVIKDEYLKLSKGSYTFVIVRIKGYSVILDLKYKTEEQVKEECE